MSKTNSLEPVNDEELADVAGGFLDLFQKCLRGKTEFEIGSDACSGCSELTIKERGPSVPTAYTCGFFNQTVSSVYLV